MPGRYAGRLAVFDLSRMEEGIWPSNR